MWSKKDSINTFEPTHHARIKNYIMGQTVAKRNPFQMHTLISNRQTFLECKKNCDHCSK